MIRMSEDDVFSGLKTLAQLKTKIQKKIEQNYKFKRDSGYIQQTFPYWEALIRGYPELFEKKKLDYYWDEARISGNSNGYGEGISTLCSGNSGYTGLWKDLQRLKKQFDKGGTKK
jgi:hypothetical protein